jgi:PAS domain S-box-containing protein
LILLRVVPQHISTSKFAALNLRIADLGREIARRKQAETELLHQKEMLRITLSSIGDGVITTDVLGFVTFMNAVAELATGWKASDAMGKPLDEVFDIVNEETRRPVPSPVAQVIREGLVVGLANHTILRRPDGTEISIDDSGAPIRNERGQLVGVVLVFHDISARRALERKLVESNQRKDEFLAMLGHELRNPLAPLMNAVKILQIGDQRKSPDELKPITEMMARQLSHLTRLVNDLLDVSRITSGKIIIERQPVDIESVLEHAIQSVPLLSERRVELSAQGPLTILGDRERLVQVFVNLLNNAAKFTNEGGEIVISAEQQSGAVIARVRDDGLGIPADVIHDVFDLFLQADKTLARSQGGLGVGLTVVRALVELHGGQVDARSDGAGKGSEFVVRLPAYDGVVAARPAADKTDEAEQLPEPRRILVVDDNIDAAQSLALLLRTQGHQVRTATDGRTALTAVAAFDPQVLLLDIGLPGMDGYELAAEIRAGQQNPVILIAVTGYGQESDRQRAMAAGFDAHLTKPVSFDAIADLLGKGGGATPVASA